ncbi:MAG: ABC transporter ATP-binding protein/permease [Paracoccaceae bacterium]|nr:ABC transporter ATP-binding protein/permease [Paracoccaceae bacterium]MDP5346540.1 ABC transporter ATP-binding protein/permease [Paracoccaceae bacterium]
MKNPLLTLLADSLLWRLLRENLRAQAPRYLLAVAAMTVVAGATASVAWIMQDIVDSMTMPGGRSRVLWVAGAVAGIFTIKGLATYVQSISLTRAGNQIVARQQIRIYDKLLAQGVGFFNITESSDLLTRVTVSAQKARAVIDTIVTSFVRDFLTLAALIGVMFYRQPLLAAVSLLIGPLAILVVRQLLKHVRAIMEMEIASMAEIIKVIQETATGIKVVKAFGLEDRMARRMHGAVRQVEARANAMARLEAVTSPMMDTLSGFAIAGVVALSALELAGDTATTPGALMSFVTALLMAYEPAKRLSRMRVSIEGGMVGVRMMFTLLDRPDTMPAPAAPRPLPAGPRDISFDKVSFGYGADAPVIQDLTLHCTAGQTTALVGPSGGGKSTLLNMILRLYDPDAGQICISGVDLRDMTLDTARAQVSYVGQDTFLFSDTVLENIRLGQPKAIEADVIAAAQAANADGFISALPQGYATQVGENGAFLSGGQRQRIAIARAILRDSPILLLDEATSALDANTEALVQDALARLTQGRTTVVIAHRLSTILDADRICVIDGGRLVEHGTATTLLAQDGLFRRLYDQQFRGQAPSADQP